MSWGWRKLLQLRNLVRPFIWTKIGNGNMASVWFDIWDPQCPLINWLSPRDITREGFNLQSHVAELVSNDGWLWPQDWLRKAPNLGLIHALNLVATTFDAHCWRDLNGNITEFSVKCAWEALRPRGNEVMWYRMVWFSHCIPRHAFYLWLVMQNSLRTQDKLRQWDIGFNTDLNTLNCPICGV
ncbi:putative reverse transcriptase domain-containing protein [Tanacetum coccineum]